MNDNRPTVVFVNLDQDGPPTMRPLGSLVLRHTPDSVSRSRCAVSMAPLAGDDPEAEALRAQAFAAFDPAQHVGVMTKAGRMYALEVPTGIGLVSFRWRGEL